MEINVDFQSKWDINLLNSKPKSDRRPRNISEGPAVGRWHPWPKGPWHPCLGVWVACARCSVKWGGFRFRSSLPPHWPSQGWTDWTDWTDRTDGVRLVALHVEKGGKRTLKGPMRRVSFLDFDRFCLKGMHQREIIELTTHNNLSMITNNYQKHTTTRSKRVEEMIKHVFSEVQTLCILSPISRPWIPWVEGLGLKISVTGWGIAADGLRRHEALEPQPEIYNFGLCHCIPLSKARRCVAMWIFFLFNRLVMFSSSFSSFLCVSPNWEFPPWGIRVRQGHWSVQRWWDGEQKLRKLALFLYTMQ